ncbi:cytochrome P450 [Abortiporus biennis]|nr:cytochrome P450 [Abortiporus biennis]
MPLSYVDIAACLLTLLLIYRWRKSRSIPYPPGPPGLPILGNALDIQDDTVFLKYQQWGKQYESPLIHLKALGTHLIIVNDRETAVDLMDRRSALYNDRPTLPMLSELMDFAWTLGFIKSNQTWKEGRKLAHQAFSLQAIKNYQLAETEGVQDLVRRMLANPDNFDIDTRHMAGRTIIRVAYGFDVLPYDDPYIRIGENVMEGVSAATNAGSYLVDIFPALKYIPAWFPGANFRRQAAIWREQGYDLRNEAYNHMLDLVKQGKMASDCVGSSVLEAVEDSKNPEYTEYIARCTLGSMYAAGADTTVATTQTFVLAMLLYPEIQKKAQAEIDRVIGNPPSRLPTFADREAIGGYLEGLILEVFRWRPAVPTNLPHRLTEADIYKGYCIPKGSIIISNSWTMSRDEKTYGTSIPVSTFDPERFLKRTTNPTLGDSQFELDPNIVDPASFVFGFGKRICPGRFLVKDTLWITAATMLAVFDMRCPKDANGVDIVPSAEYGHGLIAFPKPFARDIRPRSKEHEALIINSGL